MDCGMIISLIGESKLRLLKSIMSKNNITVNKSFRNKEWELSCFYGQYPPSIIGYLKSSRDISTRTTLYEITINTNELKTIKRFLKITREYLSCNKKCIFNTFSNCITYDSKVENLNKIPRDNSGVKVYYVTPTSKIIIISLNKPKVVNITRVLNKLVSKKESYKTKKEMQS